MILIKHLWLSKIFVDTNFRLVSVLEDISYIVSIMMFKYYMYGNSSIYLLSSSSYRSELCKNDKISSTRIVTCTFVVKSSIFTPYNRFSPVTVNLLSYEYLLTGGRGCFFPSFLLFFWPLWDDIYVPVTGKFVTGVLFISYTNE